MPDFSFVLLYVDNPAISAQFYAELLSKPIIEQSPTFAMLPLREGVMLGLWIRTGVEPVAMAQAGGGEMAFTVADAGAVSALFQAWRAKGVTIAMAPKALDFGMTFVALDPDGNRLRVFAPLPAA